MFLSGLPRRSAPRNDEAVRFALLQWCYFKNGILFYRHLLQNAEMSQKIYRIVTNCIQNC